MRTPIFLRLQESSFFVTLQIYFWDNENSFLCDIKNSFITGLKTFFVTLQNQFFAILKNPVLEPIKGSAFAISKNSIKS